MSDFRTYSYTVPRDVEFDFAWIIRKLETLARSEPNADFWALIRCAVTDYVAWAYSAADADDMEERAENVLDDIADDILWDRRDDCAKIATKYSNNCTLF